MVVDDEPDLEALVTQKFRRQIRGGDITFVFARDGIEALETAARHPQLELVLADINMPRMDGLTLLERLQTADEPLTTVIVSAYGDMFNIRTAMNRGAFDFLTKPIDFADLEATIAKTLRFVGGSREARSQRAAAERAHAACALDLDYLAEQYRLTLLAECALAQRGSASIPVRPWSAISAAAATSTIRLMATRSILHRAWKPPTSSLAHTSASVLMSLNGRRNSRRGPLATY